MSINAPGQLLGYIIQFPRALYHLLRCEPEDMVCLEVLGDVATLTVDENVLAEEDKSSQVGNPLTDKSTNLWKTFYNWIQNIHDGTLNVDKTTFILFSNKTGRNGIVNYFDKANNLDSAIKAIVVAKKKLSNIDATHEIWPYFSYVMNENEAVLLKILPRFELQIGSNGSYEDIKIEIRKKMIAVSQVDFIIKNLSGWLQKIVIEKLSAKQDAIVSWAEFSIEFHGLFERAQRRELIDFTLVNPPNEHEIKKHLKERPIFIRQLEEIKADDDDIQQAVTDYMKAKSNRYEWIEQELIDETAAVDFESKLVEYWKNQKKRIDITEKELDSHDKGMLLFTDCRSRQETIKEQSPPSTTISGTYHALANSPLLGWHPDWESTFNNPKISNNG
jgi:hypothetical protein